MDDDAAKARGLGRNENSAALRQESSDNEGLRCIKRKARDSVQSSIHHRQTRNHTSRNDKRRRFTAIGGRGSAGNKSMPFCGRARQRVSLRTVADENRLRRGAELLQHELNIPIKYQLHP